MVSTIFFISAGLACLLFTCDVHSSGFAKENDIWEEDFPRSRSGLELHDHPVTGPEDPLIETFDLNELEAEEEKLSHSEVDEETIRKAEKNAEADLLNGLNRILKNNETLEDVLRAENVYNIP